MQSFDYDTRYESKKWQTKAEMREGRLLLKVDHHFNPAEDVSSNRDALCENSVKETLKKAACVIKETEVLRKRRNYES